MSCHSHIKCVASAYFVQKFNFTKVVARKNVWGGGGGGGGGVNSCTSHFMSFMLPISAYASYPIPQFHTPMILSSDDHACK